MSNQFANQIYKHLNRAALNIEIAKAELHKAMSSLGAVGYGKKGKYLRPMMISLEMFHDDVLADIERITVKGADTKCHSPNA